MTLEIEVFSRDDPKVRVDHLPFALKPSFLEEREGVGGGSLELAADDDRLKDPAIMQDRNIVRCKLNGKYRSAFIIRKNDPTYVGSGEFEARRTLFSGNGLKDWLRDAVLHTEFGIGNTDSNIQTRTFNFASNAAVTGTQKTWYDEAKWVRPKHQAKYGGNSGNLFRYQPANWPDAPDSYWMWSQTGTTSPPGLNYFRTEFNATAKDLGAFSLFCAADDIFEVYLDSQLIYTGSKGASNWQEVQRIDFDINIVGTHVLGIKVQNTGGRAGLIATIFRNGDAAKKEKSRIVVPSKSVNWWVVGYPEPPLYPPNWSLGEIWTQLLKEAAARGVRFAKHVKPGYTDTRDSNGQPWRRDFEWTFNIGENYLSIAQKMQELEADIWIDPEDYTLKIAQSRGVDRTTISDPSIEPLMLREGRDLLSATQKSEWDVKNTLIVNSTGKRLVVSDPESVAKYGVIEDIMSLEADYNLSKAISEKVVKTKSALTQGATYTVVPREGTVPFVDYGVGDWVMAPGSEGPRTRRRVESISFTESQETGKVEYSIEFDSIFPSRQARLERWMNDTINGTITGLSPWNSSAKLKPLEITTATSGFVVPPVPPAVQSVESTASAYTQSGVPQAKAFMTWKPVEETEIGLEATIQSYEVWGANLTENPSASAPKTLMAKTTSPEVELTGLQPNSAYQFQVVAVAANGLRSDYSDEVFLDTPGINGPYDTEVLPIPTAPILTSQVGSVTAQWDGRMAEGMDIPPSVDGVRVLVSTEPGGPYNITGATIPLGGGSLTISDLSLGEVCYVTLATQAKHGALSAISEESQATVEAVRGADLDSEISDSIDEAQQKANDAADAAASLQTTVDGKNSRRRGKTEPTPPPGGWVPGDQWVRENDAGEPVELLVWNGTQFVQDQILSSEILVLGPDGAVRIKDSKITAPMISTGALDYKVARGLELYSGRIVGGTLELSDYTSNIVRASDSCESLTGWGSGTASTYSVDTTRFYEGSASIKLTGAGSIEKSFSFGSVNTVSMWLYSSVDAVVYINYPFSSGPQPFQLRAGQWSNFEYTRPTSWTAVYGPLTISTESVYGFNIDKVELRSSYTSSDTGVKIHRTNSGTAVVDSYANGKTARLDGGGLSLFNDTGFGTTVIDSNGFAKTGGGETMMIGHNSSGAGSNLTLYTGTSNAINFTTGFINSTRQAKVLFSGATYMNASQTANLTELVSQQLNGIVLLWSRYTSPTPNNDTWTSVFVPKFYTAGAPTAGTGLAMLMTSTGTTPSPTIGVKYVYISDDKITGNANNGVAPMDKIVLRYVLGV